MKILTKEQFNEMTSPTLDENGKLVATARLQLHPTNIGIINGNKYSIKVYTHEDKVEMEKIEEFEETV